MCSSRRVRIVSSLSGRRGRASWVRVAPRGLSARSLPFAGSRLFRGIFSRTRRVLRIGLTARRSGPGRSPQFRVKSVLYLSVQSGSSPIACVSLAVPCTCTATRTSFSTYSSFYQGKYFNFTATTRSIGLRGCYSDNDGDDYPLPTSTTAFVNDGSTNDLAHTPATASRFEQVPHLAVRASDPAIRVLRPRSFQRICRKVPRP